MTRANPHAQRRLLPLPILRLGYKRHQPHGGWGGSKRPLPIAPLFWGCKRYTHIAVLTLKWGAIGKGRLV